jgi:hypothetical protein
MGGTAGTDARHIQGIPLTAGAQHEEDGSHGFAVINTRPMTPQGGWFTRWEQRLDTFP